MKQRTAPEIRPATTAAPFNVSWESLLETVNGSSPTANGSSPTGNGSSPIASVFSPTVKSPEDFLRSLKRPNHRGYKRYVGSPIRYAGGKSLAVGHIVQQLPRHLTRLVSPFLGGGSLEIACAKELGMEVLAYDVFNILTCYWQMQLKKPYTLFRRLSCWQPTLECYQQVKARLKAHWLKQRLLSKEDLAAHYYFNYNLSYGPGFLGWMSKIYNCKRRYQKLLQRVRDFSAGQLRVKRAGFEKSIPAHEGDFLYCDPPYYLGEDSKMFRGIYPQRNFPVHHNGFDHAKLCDLLHSRRGGFILSYNDCQTVRDWYRDFRIVEVQWQYTLGQGETRIGKNRIENGTHHHVKKSHELLIVKDD